MTIGFPNAPLLTHIKQKGFHRKGCYMGLLPEKFVQDNLAKAQDAMFMGHPITELSRDELIAVAIKGWTGHVNFKPFQYSVEHEESEDC